MTTDYMGTRCGQLVYPVGTVEYRLIHFENRIWWLICGLKFENSSECSGRQIQGEIISGRRNGPNHC